jgi:hypothetical protein
MTSRRRLTTILVVWSIAVAWIVDRYFEFSSTYFLIAVGMAIGPGLLLSVYVILKPRPHIVAARLAGIIVAVPVAIVSSRYTRAPECKLDAFCGTTYGFIPLAEYAAYGLVLILYSTGVIERLFRKPRA